MSGFYTRHIKLRIIHFSCLQHHCTVWDAMMCFHIYSYFFFTRDPSFPLKFASCLAHILERRCLELLIEIYVSQSLGSSISERPLCKSKAKLQPVVVGDADVMSPLVSDENRVGNHRNPRRRAFKLTGLEWKRVALFHFCFCFRCYLCIFKIRHFIYPCHERETRALHSHYGSLSTNIMHHRRLFLCGLSLEFHIWPSKLLLAGWVITVTCLFLSLCCSLFLSVCLSFSFCLSFLRVFCS